jgi:hypothetical protein
MSYLHPTWLGSTYFNSTWLDGFLSRIGLVISSIKKRTTLTVNAIETTKITVGEKRLEDIAVGFIGDEI